jgi:hypothetical protein
LKYQERRTREKEAMMSGSVGLGQVDVRIAERVL